MALSFGPDWQNALLASPYRLRFELGEGDSYVTMFTSAYDRARILARAAILTHELVGVIAAYPHPKKELGAKARGWTRGTAFDLLHKMGIATEPAIASWNGSWHPNDQIGEEVEPWAHRAVRLTWDQADILLWNQIAHDIGVNPQAPVMSKLVDVERGVSVNAYDDRGMDISALKREAISSLHEKFDAWLLDYDRSRMLDVFHG